MVMLGTNHDHYTNDFSKHNTKLLTLIQPLTNVTSCHETISLQIVCSH